MRLENKVALISGGARGQGAAEVRLFAREGARVVFGDILDEEGRKVEAEVRELGGEAAYVHLDVVSEADWESAAGTAVARYGKLDILVNNAGVVSWGVLEDTTAQEWDRVMDVNAKGVFLGTRTAIPAMREAGGYHQHLFHIWNDWSGQYSAGVQCFQRSRAPADQGHCRPVRQRKHPG
jgi:3alpha(or 20beta)-hydroxysteroid dehydrogenase